MAIPPQPYRQEASPALPRDDGDVDAVAEEARPYLSTATHIRTFRRMKRRLAINQQAPLWCEMTSTDRYMISDHFSFRGLERRFAQLGEASGALQHS